LALGPALVDASLSGASGRIGPFYPWLSASPTLAIALLTGAIVLLDPRLLGLFRSLDLAKLAPVLSRFAAAALAMSLLTGFGLFSVQPSQYLDNSALRWKLLLLVAGAVNVAAAQCQSG